MRKKQVRRQWEVRSELPDGQVSFERFFRIECAIAFMREVFQLGGTSVLTEIQ